MWCGVCGRWCEVGGVGVVGVFQPGLFSGFVLDSGQWQYALIPTL